MIEVTLCFAHRDNHDCNNPRGHNGYHRCECGQRWGTFSDRIRGHYQ